MKYKTENSRILLKIKAKNAGKFRFKTRENSFAFGEIFATRTKNYHSKIYLEWQLGYDALVSEVKSGKKKTELKKLYFIGANGKKKYPYELSELVYQAIKIKLIPKSKIINLLKEINKYSNFIDIKKIKIEKSKKIKLNSAVFRETSIKLPAFFMTETTDNTQIEVHVKQQQNASGTQPMVYFCIPITTFLNYKKLLGRPSITSDELIYIFNKNNIKVLLDIIKVFAMCSKRHNFDIKEILATLLKQI